MMVGLFVVRMMKRAPLGCFVYFVTRVSRSDGLRSLSSFSTRTMCGDPLSGSMTQDIIIRNWRRYTGSASQANYFPLGQNRHSFATPMKLQNMDVLDSPGLAPGPDIPIQISITPSILSKTTELCLDKNLLYAKQKRKDIIVMADAATAASRLMV